MANMLPMKIKMGIRDSWEKPEAQVQKSIAALREVLGAEVTLKPQWQLLWAELESQYSDAAGFVPAITATVSAWCKTFQTLLEDEEQNEEWTEKVLENCLPTASGLRVRIEVGKGKQLSTTWSAEDGFFLIVLPKGAPLNPGSAYAIFNDDLRSCFDSKPKPTVSIPLHASSSSGATTDDWADVKIDNRTGTATAIDRLPAAPAPAPAPSVVQAVAEYLPSVSALARPEDLLLKPPYHLTITRSHEDAGGLEIQCSHSPTLHVLADYLKKWVKQNHSDVRYPPQLKATLCESSLGLGVMHDRLLVLSTSRLYVVNAPIVLAIVEGVLGYKLVRAGDGTWWYRREVELRKL